jgi:hypothetical protein
LPPAEFAALQQHVVRIMAAAQGLGKAVDGLPRPVTFTEQLTVHCADALDAAVAAESTPPSGNQQFKLLAWLVADALGATVPWDGSIAQ